MLSFIKSNFQKALLDLVYGKPRKPRGDQFNPREIRKVLVIRRNGIGDMICTLPFLRNLKNAWPDAQVDTLASPKNACILNGLNLVNHTFLYERGNGLFRNHYLNLSRVLLPIREQKYDLVITVKGGFSSLLATITYATNIPWRLGYVPSRGHSLDFCFNLKIELPQEREHQVESCLRFLKPLGIQRTSCDLSISLNVEHKKYAEETLKKVGMKSNGFVLFNVSAERYESRWTSKSISETGIQLMKRFQIPLVLCGLTQDRDFMNAIQKEALAAIPVILEPPTIHHFAALTYRSLFLMCGDGGPMHVAAAVGKPVFVLFSATDPRIWKPYGVPFEYAQNGRLVSDITPSQVIAKIEQWLPLIKMNLHDQTLTSKDVIPIPVKK
jgi:heptosyltransferase III